MAICFRKAVRQDFGRINELFAEMLCTIYDKEDASGYQESELDGYFAGRENWICVAEVDGKNEGFLSIEVHREQEDYLYYDDFAVSKEYRGKGIGSALMDEAERYGRGLDIAMVVLHVEQTNAKARGFYEKRGFNLLRMDGSRLCMIKRLEGEE